MSQKLKQDLLSFVLIAVFSFGFYPIVLASSIAFVASTFDRQQVKLYQPDQNHPNREILDFTAWTNIEQKVSFQFWINDPDSGIKDPTMKLYVKYNSDSPWAEVHRYKSLLDLPKFVDDWCFIVLWRSFRIFWSILASWKMTIVKYNYPIWRMCLTIFLNIKFINFVFRNKLMIWYFYMENIILETNTQSLENDSYDSRVNCEGNAVIFSILAKKDDPKTCIKIWGVKTENGYHVYVEKDGKILNKGVTSANNEDPKDINTFYPEFSVKDMLIMRDAGKACDETQKLTNAFFQTGEYKEKNGLIRSINKPMINKIIKEKLKIN